MRIIVTGGTGFLGSHFLRASLDAGHDVLALNRNSRSVRIPLNRPPLWICAGLDSPPPGIFDNCAAVVHFAATGVRPHEAGDWNACFRVNVLESLGFLEQAAKAGVKRFILCGSCFEYGLSAERVDKVPTHAALEPVGAYAASKAAATLAGMALAREKGLELMVVRPFHLFGEGDSEERFWPSLKLAAEKGEDFAMSRGEQIRDFFPVESAAQSFLRALTHPLEPGVPKIMHAGSGQARTLREFAEEWWSRLNAPGRLLIGELPYRDNEVMRYAAGPEFI